MFETRTWTMLQQLATHSQTWANYSFDWLFVWQIAWPTKHLNQRTFVTSTAKSTWNLKCEQLSHLATKQHNNSHKQRQQHAISKFDNELKYTKLFTIVKNNPCYRQLEHQNNNFKQNENVSRATKRRQNTSSRPPTKRSKHHPIVLATDRQKKLQPMMDITQCDFNAGGEICARPITQKNNLQKKQLATSPPSTSKEIKDDQRTDALPNPNNPTIVATVSNH